MSDILAIKRALSDKAREVCEYLLPRGILDKREWCVGSIQGEPGQSLKVCVQGAKAGAWADFADGGVSGDLIDLWCFTRGVTLPVALDQIRGWLGIDAPVYEKSERAKSWKRPALPACVKPKSAVLEYLTVQRGLTSEAVAAYRIGEKDRTIVFRSFLPNGDLAFVKYLGVDRSTEGKKITRVEADCEPALFGWQAIPENAREVTITEGEIDAVTMWDYGFPALSVPFGGGKGGKQAWIECEYDRLSQFETIYLALDMDAEGNLAADEIANRIGRHRCRRVSLPRKDTNECRKAGITQSEIQKCFDGSASLDPPELRRAGEFRDQVVNLFWPAGGTEVGYRLPFAKVWDKVVFRPGELSVWTGATTMGKSQILSHASVGFGDQGARVCIASLEMSPSQLVKRMVKQAGNVDRPTIEFIDRIVGWLDEWVWVFAVQGKSPVSRMLEIFEYSRARYGCDVFIVDSLMRLGVGSEDYEGQEKAVYDIVNWTVQKNVHTHLVAHARKADRQAAGVPDTEDVKGASEIGSNAFNIFSIWRNKKLEDEIAQFVAALQAGDQSAQFKLDEIAEQPTVILNVAKQRNGDWDGKVGLWFDRGTYQYRSAGDLKGGTAFIHLEREQAA